MMLVLNVRSSLTADLVALQAVRFVPGVDIVHVSVRQVDWRQIIA
jgi:hypothetical protein